MRVPVYGYAHLQLGLEVCLEEQGGGTQNLRVVHVEVGNHWLLAYCSMVSLPQYSDKMGCQLAWKKQIVSNFETASKKLASCRSMKHSEGILEQCKIVSRGYCEGISGVVLQIDELQLTAIAKDSKCGFGRDFGFGRGTAKSL